MVLSGDPALAFDSNGKLYYASLLEDNTTGDSYVGVSQSTATSPSVTFGNAVVLTGPSSTDPPDGFEDKEFIAIDNTGGTYNGRVYVAWTDFSNQFSLSAPTTIMLAASSATSPSLTFSTPLQLASSSSGIYHGAFPAVGPDGSVYVAWVELSSTSSAASATINLVKSVNGGAAFTNPDPADTHPSKTVASFTSVTPDISTGTTAGNSTVSPLRTRTYPFLAVDNTPVGSPTRGNLYTGVCGAAGFQHAAARGGLLYRLDGWGQELVGATGHQLGAAGDDRRGLHDQRQLVSDHHGLPGNRTHSDSAVQPARRYREPEDPGI